MIIARYGLDQPIPIRYVLWLANALQGDLGYRAMNGTLGRHRGLARPDRPPSS